LDELDRRGGGLFGANALTGSVGVVTINLPRLAYLAKSKTKILWKMRRLISSKRWINKWISQKKVWKLKERCLEKLTDANLYPYTKFYLRNIRRVW